MAGDTLGAGSGGAGVDRGGAGSLAGWLEAGYMAGLGNTGKEPPPFVSVLAKYLFDVAREAFWRMYKALGAGDRCRGYGRNDGDDGGNKD